MQVLELQELSYAVIIEEFSRYTYAYESTKDVNLQKSLQFLRKKFSTDIFDELESKRTLKEEHLDFLLNEYLRKITFGQWLNLTSKENILKKLISIGHSITEILWRKGEWDYCCEVKFIFIMKNVLPHAPNVTKIQNFHHCDDDLLEIIASSCPKLTYLDIFYSKVTGEGLKALYTNSDGLTQAKCPLKYLDLLFSSVDEDEEKEEVISLLKYVTTLEELRLLKLPIVLEDIQLKLFSNNTTDSNVTKYNLTSIDLTFYHGFVFTRILKSLVEICPKIKKLTLHISEAKQLELCCMFPELEEICIFSCECESKDLNNFFKEKGKNLKHLMVFSSELSISALIENCEKLETLCLDGNAYDLNDKPTRKTFQHLHSLCWESSCSSSNFPEVSFIELLASSPNLENLSLRYWRFNKIVFSNNCEIFFQNSKLLYLFIDISFSFAGVFHLDSFLLNCPFLKCVSVIKNPQIGWVYRDDYTAEFAVTQAIKESNRKIEIKFEKINSLKVMMIKKTCWVTRFP